MPHKHLVFLAFKIRAMLPIQLTQAIFTEVSEAKEKDLEMVGWEGNETTYQNPQF